MDTIETELPLLEARYERKRRELTARGFIVGPRDPRLNRLWSGRWMVVDNDLADVLDALGATGTDDASRGPWCIVGDNLLELIEEAHWMWCTD